MPRSLLSGRRRGGREWNQRSWTDHPARAFQRTPSALLLKRQRPDDLLFHINDRSVENDGGRHGLLPRCTGSIHGGEIPKVPISLTATLRWLWIACILSHTRSEYVIPIPELHHTAIGKPLEHDGRWL